MCFISKIIGGSNVGVNLHSSDSADPQSMDTTSTGHFACRKTLLVTLPTSRL